MKLKQWGGTVQQKYRQIGVGGGKGGSRREAHSALTLNFESTFNSKKEVTQLGRSLAVFSQENCI